MNSHAARQVGVAVIGGTGYVAGELLRLLCVHPVLRVHAVVSSTQVGEPVVDTFGHLHGTSLQPLRFVSLEQLVAGLHRGDSLAVFTATPHGRTGPILDSLLRAAQTCRAVVHVVDLSADFRFRDTARYEVVYGHAHPAPARAAQFTCAVPEHFAGKPPAHAVQPGCFTTAATLAAYPFFAHDLVEPMLFVAAVTGSSGSGRTPSEGTHHPARRTEMRALLGLARGGHEPDVAFVPHSGPFVRGIHATVHMTLKEPSPADALADRARQVYKGCPFVDVTTQMPRLTDVVGTNACRIGVASRGRTLVVTSVIDNLVKGAAGGAVQWMNRLLDLPDDTGLRVAGLGWF
ncbi:MAG: N-acetyl-gamma-glutamyl-phosphate reductase [Polyangiaceae bacterium]|nr:N-acetyl-gamma-glutamyl-phosphate reductase [Polyangiaceae bacterium]